MQKIAFLNGKYVNSTDKTVNTLNILIANKKIVGLGYIPDEDETNLEKIDLKGKLVFSNIFDSYVSLKSAALTKTKNSLTRASGLTAIITAPASGVSYPDIENRIFHLSPLTKDLQLQDQELADLEAARLNGALGYGNDQQVVSESLMLKALIYSREKQRPLIIRPQENETQVIARDIELVKKQGGTIIFFPVANPDSLSLIKKAKDAGLNVFCGITHADLLLNNKAANKFMAAIKENIIDFIASDGLKMELLLPGVITRLHLENKIELVKISELLSLNPLKLFGMQLKNIGLGIAPSFTVIDLKKSKIIADNELSGWPVYTVVNGEIVYAEAS